MSPNRGEFASTSMARKSLTTHQHDAEVVAVATSAFVTPYHVIHDRQVNVRSTERAVRRWRDWPTLARSARAQLSASYVRKEPPQKKAERIDVTDPRIEAKARPRRT